MVKRQEELTIKYLCKLYNVKVYPTIVVNPSFAKDGYVAGYPRAFCNMIKHINPTDKMSAFDQLTHLFEESQVFDSLLEAVLSVIVKTPCAFTKNSPLAPYQEAQVVQVKRED